MTRKELEAQAAAAQELIRRYKEERIRFYRPCSPKHQAFHNSTKPIRWVFGPNQCGKSVLGLSELVMSACFKEHPFTKRPNPKSGRFRIFTDKFQKVEEHVIPLLKEWVPRKWLKHGNWSDAYTDRYHMLRGANDSYIDMLTYDQDYSVAESVTLDGIWADEEMPIRFYAGSLPRLMARSGRIWLTVTPLHKMSWAIQFWNKTDDPNIEVFKLGFDDNPHLNEEWKQTFIATCPDDEKAARLRGEFLEFGGLVYKELDSQVHFLSDWKEPEMYCPVIFALDPHPRKASVATWSLITPNDDVIVFDELEVKGTATQIVQAIKDRESGHKHRTSLRLIDPAANKQISGIGSSLTTLGEFENAGMGFSLAENSEAGYNVVHEYLQWDKTRDIDSMNRPRLYFASTAMKTWQGMKDLMWDEYRFANEMRDPKEHIKDFHKDFPDCVRYTVAQRPNQRGTNFAPVDLKFAVQAD